MSVKCLIPAAGKGTRMRPLSHSLPKAMLPVAGKPTIFHIIDRVVAAGIRDFVIITGYLRELMEEEILKAYPDLNIEFIEQVEQKGLGHALLLARDSFSADDSMFLVYGDTLFDADLDPILKSDKAMIGVYEVDDPRRFGIIELESDGEHINNFIEKPDEPSTNLAMPGVNFFPQASELFRALQEIVDRNILSKGEFQATDAFQLMLKEYNTAMGFFRISAWDDAGTLEAMLATNETILLRDGSKALSENIENSEIIDPVYISSDVKIRNSTIGPGTSIAQGCTIENSHISNTIIDIETTVEDSHISGSLIGRQTEIKNVSGRLVVGDHCFLDGKGYKG